MRRATLWMTIVLAGLLAAACQALAPRSQRPVLTSADEPPDVLAGALREFADDFRSSIDSAASQAGQLDLTRPERKAVTTWRVQAGQLLRHAFNQDDPREILLDVWSLCRRMVDYFDSGPGAAEFGPARVPALTAAQGLLSRYEDLAQAHTSGDTLGQIRAKVEEYARSNALQAGFIAPSGKDLSDISPGQDVLQWILNVPLAPLQGVQKIGQTSDALRDMSRTADRFTDVVDDLPATSRREALRLAEDLERLPSVMTTTQSVQQIAASTERFTQVVEELPGRTRAEAEKLLDHVDEALPQARNTLTEAQKTADAIRTATTELRELTGTLDQTITRFTEAGRAWTATADAVGAASQELTTLIRPTPEPSAEPPPADDATTKPSFRFEDMTVSAEALTRTTIELRGLVGDLQRLLASGGVSGEASKVTAPAVEVLDRAGLTSRGLIDHAAWRAAQLLVLLAVLLVAYRWVTRAAVRREGK